MIFYLLCCEYDMTAVAVFEIREMAAQVVCC